MKPRPPLGLVMSAVHALIACRAGRAGLMPQQIATMTGATLPTVRLAIYRLHCSQALQVQSVAGDGGTRQRMRVRLADRWSEWTGWSRTVPYSFTTQAFMRRHSGDAQQVA